MNNVLDRYLLCVDGVESKEFWYFLFNFFKIEFQNLVTVDASQANTYWKEKYLVHLDDVKKTTNKIIVVEEILYKNLENSNKYDMDSTFVKSDEILNLLLKSDLLLLNKNKKNIVYYCGYRHYLNEKVFCDTPFELQNYGYNVILVADSCSCPIYKQQLPIIVNRFLVKFLFMHDKVDCFVAHNGLMQWATLNNVKRLKPSIVMQHSNCFQDIDGHIDRIASYSKCNFPYYMFTNDEYDFQIRQRHFSKPCIKYGYPNIEFKQKSDDTGMLNTILIMDGDASVYKTNSEFIPSEKNYLELIELLLHNYKYKIVFRPQPRKRNDENLINIYNKYINHKNFMIDTSDNYKKYIDNVLCVVGNFTSAVYTFALETLRPAIFLQEKYPEIDYLMVDDFKIPYIKKSLGFVALNNLDVLNNIEKIIENPYLKEEDIHKIRDKFYNKEKDLNKVFLNELNQILLCKDMQNENL